MVNVWFYRSLGVEVMAIADGYCSLCGKKMVREKGVLNWIKFEYYCTDCDKEEQSNTSSNFNKEDTTIVGKYDVYVVLAWVLVMVAVCLYHIINILF